jgi:hypothetical protein
MTRVPIPASIPRNLYVFLALWVLGAGVSSPGLAAPATAPPAPLGSPEALRALVESGKDADLRWPDFSRWPAFSPNHRKRRRF